MGTIARGIGALAIALSSAMPASAELPSDYRLWPIRYESGNKITYRQNDGPDAPVVREFQNSRQLRGSFWRILKFVSIGYNSGSALPPESKPMEVYIEVDSKYGLSPKFLKGLEEAVRKDCQRCHIVTNGPKF